MPSRVLVLDPGAQRVELTWGAFWKNFVVRLDGREILRLDGDRALREGAEAVLPDGARLRVQLVKQFLGASLHVTRDGKPLPGSGGDPAQQLKTAYGLVYVLAGLNAIAGVVGMLVHTDFTNRLGLGIGNILVAAILTILGYFASRRSLAALAIAIGFLAFDIVTTLVLFAKAGEQPPVGGVVARMFLLIPIARGIPAIRALKASERATGADGVAVGGRPLDDRGGVR